MGIVEIIQGMVKAKEAEERAKRSDEAYAELNNLYLSIERGEVKLTKKEYFQLDGLLNEVYSHTEPMHEWWWKEFQKLPGWLNV
jgi:hypothetical protein